MSERDKHNKFIAAQERLVRFGPTFEIVAKDHAEFARDFNATTRVTDIDTRAADVEERRRSAGGSTKGARFAAAHHARWQAEIERITAINSSLSNHRLAELVAEATGDKPKTIYNFIRRTQPNKIARCRN